MSAAENPTRSPVIKVDAFVGGYMGDSYRVRSDADALRYEHLREGYQPQENLEIRPPAERRAEFGEAVDRIGVWSWELRYADNSVTDGTHWSIQIADSTCRVESAGSNAAPAGFSDLCEAISRLVGAPFQ